MTKQIRVEMTSNGYARDYDVTEGGRHNGGRVVIVTCDAEDLPAVEAALDASRKVASYEVRA